MIALSVMLGKQEALSNLAIVNIFSFGMAKHGSF